MKVREIVKVLEDMAPTHLAAEWDNVGLLVGDGESQVSALMLCIDLTEQVLSEARKGKARMIMAYHPVILKPASRVTASESAELYAAAVSGVSVYSMHTALDVAPGGANDVLAEVLGIDAPRPLEPTVRRGGCKVVTPEPGPSESTSDARSSLTELGRSWGPPRAPRR
jgi:dinuclear metal center YbgI/SA1388 family protein